VRDSYPAERGPRIASNCEAEPGQIERNLAPGLLRLPLQRVLEGMGRNDHVGFLRHADGCEGDNNFLP